MTIDSEKTETIENLKNPNIKRNNIIINFS